jgi:hypothetical protein
MCAGVGCAKSTYQYGTPHRPFIKRISGESNTLTFGGEHPNLDRAEKWIFYSKEKLKQWFPDEEPTVDPEELRRLAICKAQEYLALNELTDVKIDVRRYDPASQWSRLRENDSIHPLWKYTGGSMSILSYTLIPGRVLRADNFNPYTNTLSLNSSDPSTALYAAAEAKIIFNRRYPGFYLATCKIPIFGISKRVYVANDVLSYVRNRQEWHLEKDLTPKVFSDICSECVLHTLTFVPGTNGFPFYFRPLISLAGSTAGEAVGHAVLNQRQAELQPSESTTQDTAIPTKSEVSDNPPE